MRARQLGKLDLLEIVANVAPGVTAGDLGGSLQSQRKHGQRDVHLDSVRSQPRSSGSTSEQKSKAQRRTGPSTTNSGYIACRSKVWLDDVFKFLNNKDNSSLGAYLLSGKCIALEDGAQVTVTDWGFVTTEFVYQGTKYYAPSEAINN